MFYKFTADSFGSMLPENWEEMVEELNTMAEERGIEECDIESANELWEYYCNNF